MADLMDVEEDVEAVMREMWKFCGTYALGNGPEVEDRMPVWYIMDEFGSRIAHCFDDVDKVNVRVVPFISAVGGQVVAFSLLFPVKNVALNEEIVRDALEGPQAQDPIIRKSLNNIWRETSLEGVDFAQTEPEAEFFASGRINETLPDPEMSLLPFPPNGRKIRVYAEYSRIREHLKHPRFEVVSESEEADVLWLTSHFKRFHELDAGKRINQFPYENVVTIKDLSCVVARRSPKPVLWLPTTYNLKTELAEFVAYFRHREGNGLDNHWIVKPWNLARGLDIQISDNLSHILKLPFSGPKIAQKYIERPVLFERPEVGKVKFDVRYILLLRSVRPLKLFAYDRFWLRFANKAFDLDQLDVYEKHFTVMNYDDDIELKQMFCHDFIESFEAQNVGVSWLDEVQPAIFRAFRELFESACAKDPPAGIGASPQSRAMYAVDLMLEWNERKKVQPKLLEVNWGPDCDRACDYYPDFFDNVFSALFLDETQGQHVTDISE